MASTGRPTGWTSRIRPAGKVKLRGANPEPPALRNTFAQIFATNPELHADVPTWIEVGDWVCIHSIVEDWIRNDGSRTREEWVELYQVVNGKITRLQLFS